MDTNHISADESDIPATMLSSIDDGPERLQSVNTPHQITNVWRFFIMAFMQVVALIIAEPTIQLSSQWLPNTWSIRVALGLVLILPLLFIAWFWLGTALNRHALTQQRLIVRRGILNRHSDYLELYRVKDVELYQPLIERLFGVGTLVLHTSDRSTPVLYMRAMRQPRQLAKEIRTFVESARRRKGVREID